MYPNTVFAEVFRSPAFGRAGNKCYELTDRYNYEVVAKWPQGENVKLQVRFDEEYFSDYFLTDESFLRLTYQELGEDVTITG